MEIEEDFNLKMLDEVKHDYLETFKLFKNGHPKWIDIVERIDRITFLFKFICIKDNTLIINYLTGGQRLIFFGEQICGNQKVSLSIIGKTQEVQDKIKNILKTQDQYYILHRLLIFQKGIVDVERKIGNKENYRKRETDGLSEGNNENYYYVLDEESQILEDESMDFTSCLTHLSENNGIGENIFESHYGRRATDTTLLKLLIPKVLTSFEGIIISVIEGNNVLQVDELMYGLCLNSKIDRFYRLKVRSGQNYLDQIEIYLLYDVNDFEAISQLKFYLIPYQRVLLSRCLRHFDSKMEMFLIAYFRSANFSASVSNLERFHMSPRGIEFFSRQDREQNRQRCDTQRFDHMERITEIYNLQLLIDQEGCFIRRHLRVIVRVRKIKYWKVRLVCAACKSEWTNGLKHCLRCKQTVQYVSFQFQILVQDQEYLGSHAYLYLKDELAVSFFSISENEKALLQKYLNQNEPYIQMYYSLRQNYPLNIVKFKDRIFTKDLVREIIVLPFADLMNKVFTNTQLLFREKKLSNQFHHNRHIDDNLPQSNLSDHITKQTFKNLIFINGTYIHSPFAPTKLSLQPIPCLHLVHIFPSTPTIQQSLHILSQIQVLQIQLQQYK